MKGDVALIVLLIIVLGTLIGLHWLVLGDPSQRNFIFLPGMVESVARNAQSPPTVLDGGAEFDHRPPPGSIARGYSPLTYSATPEGALLAGRELLNPIAIDDVDAVARGAFVFNTFCSVCHGAGGRGDGTVTTRGVPPPPSLLLEHALQMTDGQMYHLISLGQGNMSSYASQVERMDRWRVVGYIRSLQESALTADATAIIEDPGIPSAVEEQ